MQWAWNNEYSKRFVHFKREVTPLYLTLAVKELMFGISVLVLPTSNELTGADTEEPSHDALVIFNIHV